MATVPNIEKIERAILDELSKRRVRGDQIFKPMAINIELQKSGFTGAEVTAGLQSMMDKGWVENGSAATFLKLTALGFAAI